MVCIRRFFLAFANYDSMYLVGLDSDRLLCQKKMKSNGSQKVFAEMVGIWCHQRTIAFSLQDYQDLCLALPEETTAMWAFSTGNWFWPFVEQLLSGACEECVPITIAIACIMWPYKRKHFSKNDSVVMATGYKMSLTAVILVGFYVCKVVPSDCNIPL